MAFDPASGTQSTNAQHCIIADAGSPSAVPPGSQCFGTLITDPDDGVVYCVSPDFDTTNNVSKAFAIVNHVRVVSFVGPGTLVITPSDNIGTVFASGAADIQLPLASKSKGRVIRVIQTDANAVDVKATLPNQINNAPSVTVGGGFATLTASCDGIQWAGSSAPAATP